MPKLVASKNDWIKLGYQLFSQSGEQGLNVDKMSHILKCNKSSFYWHFKSKKGFMNDLLNHWVENDTNKIIEQVNKQPSPEEKLICLVKISFKKDENLDFFFYLKKYAQSNKHIKVVTEKVDIERLQYVQHILGAIGYSNDESKTKASIFYKYLIGYHEMIRYKKQSKNYLADVLVELTQFIDIKAKP